MQGAPVTVQVTSPVSWLSSVRVIVLEIVPLMFAAPPNIGSTAVTAHNAKVTRRLVLGVVIASSIAGHRLQTPPKDVKSCPKRPAVRYRSGSEQLCYLRPAAESSKNSKSFLKACREMATNGIYEFGP